MDNGSPEPQYNETHYVCSGGCKLVSNNPGKCTSPGCPRGRNPLTECKCTDGKHLPWIHFNDPNHNPELQ